MTAGDGERGREQLLFTDFVCQHVFNVRIPKGKVNYFTSILYCAKAKVDSDCMLKSNQIKSERKEAIGRKAIMGKKVGAEGDPWWHLKFRQQLIKKRQDNNRGE